MGKAQSVGDRAYRNTPRRAGRQPVFVALALLAATIAVLLDLRAPELLVLPVIAAAALSLAGLAALVALAAGTRQADDTFSLADLAGACALGGSVAALLSRPEKLLALAGYTAAL